MRHIHKLRRDGELTKAYPGTEKAEIGVTLTSEQAIACRRLLPSKRFRWFLAGAKVERVSGKKKWRAVL